jgi:hypothetical protein
MSESERLAKEAKEMEARLSILQDKVKTQQLDTATISGSGKWKSSSTEKGSIRAYGKEVTDKFKKRIVNEGGVIPSVTGTMKTTSRQSSFDGDLKLAGTSSGGQGNFTTKGIAFNLYFSKVYNIFYAQKVNLGRLKMFANG